MRSPYVLGTFNWLLFSKITTQCFNRFLYTWMSCEREGYLCCYIVFTYAVGYCFPYLHLSFTNVLPFWQPSLFTSRLPSTERNSRHAIFCTWTRLLVTGVNVWPSLNVFCFITSSNPQANIYEENVISKATLRLPFLTFFPALKRAKIIINSNFWRSQKSSLNKVRNNFKVTMFVKGGCKKMTSANFNWES